MGVIAFMRRKIPTQEPSNTPWERDTAIYVHIKQHIDVNNGRLLESGYVLPDEDRRSESLMGMHWAPGALDGTFGHHADINGGDERVKLVAQAVENIALHNCEADKRQLYEALCGDDLVSYIDAVIENILQRQFPYKTHLQPFLIFLLRRAPDRGPVKFAIAMLGLIGDINDLELIRTLALHEEFTLYSAVAIGNMLEDPEPTLWALAKKVEGWGRIQIVERLASTEDVDIQDWLLRHGYRNRVMYAYTAHIAAVTGQLHMMLSRGFIDDELLLAAGDILQALIDGGPTEDIRDYEQAADSVNSYLRHVSTRREQLNLHYLLTTYTIVDYITQEDEDWDEENNGWSEEKRLKAIEQAEKIAAWPAWHDLVQQELQNPDERRFQQANYTAKLLRINTWDVHWQRLQARPLDASCWYEIMQIVNRQHIQTVIDFAANALPLAHIASGAGAESVGIGEEFNAHECLEMMLQELDRFPGYGWVLLHTGLQSPIIRNRNMALSALEQWHHNSPEWHGTIQPVLRTLHAQEPDEEVRARLQALL